MGEIDSLLVEIEDLENFHLFFFIYTINIKWCFISIFIGALFQVD